MLIFKHSLFIDI